MSKCKCGAEIDENQECCYDCLHDEIFVECYNVVDWD